MKKSVNETQRCHISRHLYPCSSIVISPGIDARDSKVSPSSPNSLLLLGMGNVPQQWGHTHPSLRSSMPPSVYSFISSRRVRPLLGSHYSRRRLINAFASTPINPLIQTHKKKTQKNIGTYQTYYALAYNIRSRIPKRMLTIFSVSPLLASRDRPNAHRLQGDFGDDVSYPIEPSHRHRRREGNPGRL